MILENEARSHPYDQVGKKESDRTDRKVSEKFYDARFGSCLLCGKDKGTGQKEVGQQPSEKSECGRKEIDPLRMQIKCSAHRPLTAKGQTPIHHRGDTADEKIAEELQKGIVRGKEEDLLELPFFQKCEKLLHFSASLAAGVGAISSATSADFSSW